MLAYNEVEQEQLCQDDVTLLEEDRLQAAMRAAHYQQALRRYHSHKVHARSLEEIDIVLRRIQSAKNSNKLTPKWEGPYWVIRDKAWRSPPGDRKWHSSEQLLEH